MNPIHKITQLELRRKILHILAGIVFTFLILTNNLSSKILFLFLVIGVFCSLISLKINIPFVKSCLNIFERPDEKIPGRAVLSAGAGVLLIMQLFSKDIVLASMLILTFADPISHIIGKVFGKTKSIFNEKKNIEGNICGAILSSIIAMFAVSPALAMAGSLIAMSVELVIIKVQDIQIDDNLIIPLVAGTTMHLIQLFL